MDTTFAAITGSSAVKIVVGGRRRHPCREISSSSSSAADDRRSVATVAVALATEGLFQRAARIRRADVGTLRGSEGESGAEGGHEIRSIPTGVTMKGRRRMGPWTGPALEGALGTAPYEHLAEEALMRVGVG